MFIQWQKYLKEDFKIEYLDIPGRGYLSRKKEEFTMEGIAESLAEEIVKRKGTDGYAIFGYCFGASVAYEVCLALEKEGADPPEHLYVCGSYPPLTTEPVQNVLERRERREDLIRMFYHMFPSYLFKDVEMQKKICSRYMEILYDQYDRNGTFEEIQREDPSLRDLMERNREKWEIR